MGLTYNSKGKTDPRDPGRNNQELLRPGEAVCFKIYRERLLLTLENF